MSSNGSYSSSSDSESDADAFRARVAAAAGEGSRSSSSSSSSSSGATSFSSSGSDSDSDSSSSISSNSGSAVANMRVGRRKSAKSKSVKAKRGSSNEAEVITGNQEEAEDSNTLAFAAANDVVIFDPYTQSVTDSVMALFEDEAAVGNGGVNLRHQRTSLNRRANVKIPMSIVLENMQTTVDMGRMGAAVANHDGTDSDDSDGEHATDRSPGAAEEVHKVSFAGTARLLGKAMLKERKILASFITGNQKTLTGMQDVGLASMSRKSEKDEGESKNGGYTNNDEDSENSDEHEEEGVDEVRDEIGSAKIQIVTKKGLTSVGVSLLVLQRLRKLSNSNSVHNKEDNKAPSTKDVVNAVIKPMTKLGNCSLLRFLAGDKVVNKGLPFNVPAKFFGPQKQLYGPATVYISQAWDYTFDELVSSLEAFEEDERKKTQSSGLISMLRGNTKRMYYWLDFACMNMWKPMCGPHKCPSIDWFREAIPNLIKDIGAFNLILLPWDAPVAFERTWCLYEMCACYLAKVDINLRFSKSRHALFMSMILDHYEECFSLLSKFLVSTLDSSCASYLARENMLDVIDEVLIQVKAGAKDPPANANVFLKRLLHRWLDREAVTILITAELELRAASIKLNDEQFTARREAMKKNLLCNAFGCIEIFDESETVQSMQRQCLTIMQNIARLYVQMDELELAKKKYQECIGEAERRCGTNHLSTLTLQGNLAVVLRKLGTFDDAETLMKSTIAKKESELGQIHPSTVASLTNLAVLLKETGKLEQSRSVFLRVLSIQEEIFGENDEITLGTVECLATVLLMLNFFEGTMILLKRLLLARTVKNGKAHRETLAVLETIGDLHIRQEDWINACSVYKKSLSIREANLGTRDPTTLNCYNRLAKIQEKLEDWDAAEALYIKLLAGTKDTMGAFHFGVFSTRDKLISLELKKPFINQSAVVQRCNVLLEEAVHALTFNDPVTCTIAHHLADSLFLMKRYKDASNYYRKAYTHRKAICGENNVYTMLSMHGLALALANLKQFREAYQVFKDLIALWDAHPDYGPSSEKTIQSIVSFVDICFVGGDTTTAEEMLRRLLTYNQNHPEYGQHHPHTLEVLRQVKELHRN